MAQDDYYYEIQLTNKQLVFYFMAGATGLILSFLAGVMVGRGVDAAGSEVQAAGAKTVREERIVPEEAKPVAPPSAEELSYAQRLESDKPDEPLDKAKAPAKEAPKEAAKDKEPAKPAKEGAGKKPAKEKPAPAAAAPPASVAAAPATPATTPAAPPTTPATAPAKPAADSAGSATKAAKPAAAGTFTIQVGAFKEKATADALVSRLKAKGYAAYAAAPDGPEGGLFNVRVGSYPAKADAERIKTKLRDEEKFKPIILPN